MLKRPSGDGPEQSSGLAVDALEPAKVAGQATEGTPMFASEIEGGRAEQHTGGAVDGPKAAGVG